jgi:hypothetical protein
MAYWTQRDFCSVSDRQIVVNSLQCSAKTRNGQRCSHNATHEAKGQPVCWQHSQASDGGRTASKRRLRSRPVVASTRYEAALFSYLDRKAQH